MDTGAACKEAVAVADLNNIIFGGTCCRKCSCDTSLPHIDIVLSIACDDTSAGRTACRMNADTVRERHCQQSVWILLAQIFLAQKRQLMEILNAFNILRFHTVFIHLLSIVRNRFVHALYGLDQTLILPGSDLFP